MQLESRFSNTAITVEKLAADINKKNSMPQIRPPAMFANTLPTNVNAERICVENTLIVPQILYWLGISVPSTLDGYVFINNYALSEEWREEVDTE